MRIANILFIIFLAPISLFAKEFSIELQTLRLDSDYDFLPKQESSFDNSIIDKGSISYDFGKIVVGFTQNNLLLEGQRQSYPKKVDVDVAEQQFVIGFKTDYGRLSFGVLSTSKLSQQYPCYTFASITAGSCVDADISVTSNNSKYDNLNGDLILLTGEVEGFSSTFEFKDLPITLRRYLDTASISLDYHEHTYNWMTPLEDIQSDFLLGYTLNGVKLGDALASEFKRLPQRTPWRSYFLKTTLSKQVYFTGNMGLNAELDLGVYEQENYVSAVGIPKQNSRFHMGIFYKFSNVSIELFAEHFTNNLIGYHPIVVNQRTEKSLSQNFGQLGLSIKFTK